MRKLKLFLNTEFPRRFLFGFVMCLLFLQVSVLHANDPYAIRLNKSTGLPSNSVYGLFQDSKGFIWISSDEGLTMYDGFKYTTFKADFQSSTAGSCIQEDAFGRIWYENFDGYLYFVDANRKVLSTINQKTSIGFVPYGITKKHLFVFQQKGIDVYKINDLSFLKTIPLEVERLEHALSDGQSYFFINSNALYKVSENLELTKNNFVFDSDEKTKQLYRDKNGVFVVSKFNEASNLYRFDSQMKLVKTFALTKPKFIHGAHFIDDQFWISTPEGCVVINSNGNQETYYPSKSISSVMKDRQNNYWFATTNEGLFVVPDLKNTVHTVGNFKPSKIIKLNDKSLIIGTKKGEIIETTWDLKKCKTIFSSPERNEIQYLYSDPKQKFIAFVAKGFTVIDAQHYKEIFTINNAIKEVCPIDDNYFGFAASGLYGIFSHPLSPSSKDSNWSEYLQTVEKSSPGFWQIAINVRARSVAYDSSNETLYFGTNNGLFRLTKTAIKEIRSAGQSVYVSRIIVHENELYVLTTRGNFYRIHTNDNFELLNTKYEIPKFEIKILKQFGSNLIFSSNQDIHNIDLNTQAHFIYGIDIEPYEINDILLDDKHLLILTDDGIIQTLGESKSKNKESKPLFYINDFKIQGESKPTLEHIIVDYNENQASLNFSILDFGKTQTLHVYYQLNDNKWELISSETRTLNFPFLPHGTYRIRFKLDDEIQDQTLLFTILTPFWLRWWFVALFVLFALVMIATTIVYKRRKLFRKLALLEEKIQLEKNLSKSVLTSIKAQMNPHFFYNALNTIQAYIFTNDADNAGKYLSKFSKLTRRILEMSEAEFVNLSEEINTLKLYLELEEARFDDDFFFKIEVDENVDLDMMRIPPMLIQPYIENAIKHGLLHKSGEKHLRVSFEIREEILMISIDDNGIGRATSNQRNAIKNAKHKSFATEANAKRLKVLNQTGETSVTCEIIDNVDANNGALGTCVILRISPHTD